MWAAVLAVVGLGGAIQRRSQVSRVFDPHGRRRQRRGCGLRPSTPRRGDHHPRKRPARRRGRSAVRDRAAAPYRRAAGVLSVWQDWPVAVVHYAVNGRTPPASRWARGLSSTASRNRVSSRRRAATRTAHADGPWACSGRSRRPVPALPARMAAYVARARPRSRRRDGDRARRRPEREEQGAAVAALADGVVIDEMAAPRPFLARTAGGRPSARGRPPSPSTCGKRARSSAWATPTSRAWYGARSRASSAGSRLPAAASRCITARSFT